MDNCETCGNVYQIHWIKKGEDYNDFGYRYCPFCGEMFDTFIIEKGPKNQIEITQSAPNSHQHDIKTV